jgi:hypothetical protein
MWRVPGYGDFLDGNDPGVRQRHQEAAAPEGSTDAIAWLQLMTSDQFADDVPPHRSVTFSVDDTDAIAERTKQLGGTVTVPPFDVPYARIAVVTDPQGAVFTVSKYIPPAAQTRKGARRRSSLVQERRLVTAPHWSAALRSEVYGQYLPASLPL